MAEIDKTAVAKAVYADLCAALEERNWHFQRHDDDLVVTYGVSGDDLPMEFVFKVDADRQLLRVLSKIPFTVPEDKRMDLAIATCVATNGIVDGSFDFDITDGTILFRMTASFLESKIGSGLFDYLVSYSCHTVDLFNDEFLALCKGVISISDFIKAH